MGKIATNILAAGDGWSVSDVVCTSGPRDRPFEERHDTFSIAVVLEGSFQYRSCRGSVVMSPGSLLLDNYGEPFECSHEHGTGDRCVSFQYTPEFFERAGVSCAFAVHRLPPVAALAPWVVEARFGVEAPEKVNFGDLAFGLPSAVLALLAERVTTIRQPGASDERRISGVLRFIAAHLAEPLPLQQLAQTAGMSEFHFLRIFRQVTGLTPHQYILRARLREAAFRLKGTDKPVLQVALDVGFQDLSNFNHAFRAEFSTNPARFRSKGVGLTRVF